MKALSFRQRLTLFSAAAIAVVLVIGSASTYLIVRSHLRSQVDGDLRAQAARANPGFTLGAQLNTVDPTAVNPPKGVGHVQVTASGSFGSAPVFALVIGADTPVPGEPGGVTLPVSQRAHEVARTQSGAYFSDVDWRGSHLRMYVTPVASGYAVVIARSLAEVDSALRTLGWSLGITCLVGIVLAAIVGAAVARGALRPVRRLTETAERITHTHDLGQRIDTDGDDELNRLGASFNEMLDSLDGAIRSQRRLVSDASHELRTPLTSLRTNIDLLRQGVALSEGDRDRLLRDVGNELEELSALVADLVDLARGSQRDLHLRSVRLDEIGESVLKRAQARFPALDFVLDAEPTTVSGDPEQLDRALWNLIENGAKWSKAGDRVEVTIADGEVTVRDHGPGVSATDRPFIFDRFYRSDASRSQPGSGLGLAIVRQIAETHGGRVEVEEAEGGGARFRLSLVNGHGLQGAPLRAHAR